MMLFIADLPKINGLASCLGTIVHARDHAKCILAPELPSLLGAANEQHPFPTAWRYRLCVR